MGKNRLMQLRRRTPFELRRDRRVADQRAVLHAYHGPPDRGAVANIDIDAAERGRRVRKLCDVGQIEERGRLDGNPVTDSRRMECSTRYALKFTRPIFTVCISGMMRRSRIGKRINKLCVWPVAYTGHGAPLASPPA